MLEDKVKQKRAHSVQMENRNKMIMTGITDVVSFDLNKVILQSDYGVITIKGDNLHVNKLSVDKGELDVDGVIASFDYSELNTYSAKGESIFNRLFK